ncbi:hypothetical protein DJ023_03290 [Pantoea agglomerans]|nr:hypothetical protein [Pantoea agglomerans]
MPAILPASGQRIINLPSSFIRNQESGIRNQESGIRNQESGIRNQESGKCVRESVKRESRTDMREPVALNQAGLISITPAAG